MVAFDHKIQLKSTVLAACLVAVLASVLGCGRGFSSEGSQGVSTQLESGLNEFAPSRSEEGPCFNGATDQNVSKFLRPNFLCLMNADGECTSAEKGYRDFHEDPKTILKIHRKIAEAWKKYGVDPRILYYRLIGEAGGDPYLNAYNHDGGYGLFQFTGSLNEIGNHKSNLEQLYKRHPKVSPRLIQVRYYVDKFLAKLAESANNGGCKKADFSNYSALEKLTYLGYAKCGPNASKIEARVFRMYKRITGGAARVLSSLIDFENPPEYVPKNPLPLCSVYNETAAVSPQPGPDSDD